MKTCPCEGCISFAICYNLDQIKCEDLYKFVSRTSHFNDRGVEKELYVGSHPGTDKVIYEVYDRFLEGTTLSKYKVLLTRNKNMARANPNMKYQPKVKAVFSHDQ